MISQRYTDGKEHVHVLSYGGGTQSTALLLKALKDGISGVKPDYVIYSDTGNEPAYVDRQIELVNEHIKERYGKEIIITNNGNIFDDVMRSAETGERSASLPYHTEKDGETGMTPRQCTADYKITPVKREIRKQLGYSKGQRVKEMVHLWKGISTDEIQRVKPIADKWIEAEHPLVWDLSWDRTKCIHFVEQELGWTPFSSACIICPFHSNDAWLEIKRNDPEGFERACQLDEKLREGKMKYNSNLYLHKSRVPLREADLSENQMSLFDNECEGMCGM